MVGMAQVTFDARQILTTLALASFEFEGCTLDLRAVVHEADAAGHDPVAVDTVARAALAISEGHLFSSAEAVHELVVVAQRFDPAVVETVAEFVYHAYIALVRRSRNRQPAPAARYREEGRSALRLGVDHLQLRRPTVWAAVGATQDR